MASRFPSPITADEFDRMIQQGLLTDEDKVELLEGEIVDKMTEGDSHALCVITLTNLFRFRAPADVLIAVNGPAWIAPDSIPEPDVFLIGQRPMQLRRRPRPEDILLLIEVCDTSLSRDLRVKVPLYARAGVPEVWLIDVNGECLHRFLDPQPAPPEGWRKGQTAPTWRVEDVSRRGDTVAPLACPEARLTLDEMLGPAGVPGSESDFPG